MEDSDRSVDDKTDLRLWEGAAARCIEVNVEMRMSREKRIRIELTSDSNEKKRKSQKMVAFRAPRKSSWSQLKRKIV